MTPEFLKQCIIEPVLWQLRYFNIDLASGNSIPLLMETCAVESDLGTFIGQLEGGCALGIFQIEPATYDDLLINFINFRPEFEKILNNFYPKNGKKTFGYKLLQYNHQLNCAIARLKYWQIPHPIPETRKKRAHYWKKYYNSYEGKGTIEKYLKKSQEYLGDG